MFPNDALDVSAPILLLFESRHVLEKLFEDLIKSRLPVRLKAMF